MTHWHVWHDSFTHMWHDSFTRVTWLIDTCDMTHLNACDMTHSHMWHDSLTHVTRGQDLEEQGGITEVRGGQMLHHIAAHCSSLQHTTTHCKTLQHPATPCNTLQHTAKRLGGARWHQGCYIPQEFGCYHTLQHTLTRCSTLQHAATHCNTLQHTTTRRNTLQHAATHCNTTSRSKVASRRSDHSCMLMIWFHTGLLCMNASCDIWMSDASYRWVVRRMLIVWLMCMNVSSDTWMGEASYRWVVRRMLIIWLLCMNASRDVRMSDASYGWVVRRMLIVWLLCMNVSSDVRMSDASYWIVSPLIHMMHHSFVTWHIHTQQWNGLIAVYACFMSSTNEWCNTWMSGETISLLCMNVSSEVRMSDATYGWVERQFHCCVWICHVTCEWVMQNMDGRWDNLIAVYECVTWRANE